MKGNTKLIEVLNSLLADELTAVNQYMVHAEDFATREVLESILQDEDRHIDGIEELQDQIKHIGLPVFLSSQIKE